MGLLQGLAGNLTVVSKDELQKNYSKYLISGEEIHSGYKLVRDILLFTNLRIIDFDKQGATGKKMSVDSIFLDTICEVSCETAGFGIDDSEIKISYIKSPYRKAHNIQIGHKKYEFPKKFDFTPLYVYLLSVSNENNKKLNS